MAKRNKHNDHYNEREDNRYNDGKHFSKKSKNVDKRSRNNVKLDLRKELYN